MRMGVFTIGSGMFSMVRFSTNLAPAAEVSVMSHGMLDIPTLLSGALLCAKEGAQ